MGASVEGRHDVVPGAVELPDQHSGRPAGIADYELHAHNIQGMSLLPAYFRVFTNDHRC